MMNLEIRNLSKVVIRGILICFSVTLVSLSSNAAGITYTWTLSQYVTTPVPSETCTVGDCTIDSFTVKDINGNTITSGSSVPPHTITYSGRCLRSKDFGAHQMSYSGSVTVGSSYCGQNQTLIFSHTAFCGTVDGYFSIAIKKNAAPWTSTPTVITGNYCTGDIFEQSLTNGGGATTYILQARLDGVGEWKEVKTYTTDPQKYSVELTHSKLNSVFGTNDFYGENRIEFRAVAHAGCTGIYIHRLLGKITLYAQPPTISNVIGKPPKCPGGNDGEILVNYSNVIGNFEFTYTIARQEEMPSGGCAGTNIVDETLDGISCGSPGVWCPEGNNYSDKSWCRLYVGNAVSSFDASGSIEDKIDPSDIMDDSNNSLKLSAGLYTVLIETKDSDGTIYCNSSIFLIEIPEQTAVITHGTVTSSPARCETWANGTVTIPNITTREGTTSLSYSDKDNGFTSGSISMTDLATNGNKLTISGVKSGTRTITLTDGCSTTPLEVEKEVGANSFEVLINNDTTYTASPTCLTGTSGTITSGNGKIRFEATSTGQNYSWKLGTSGQSSTSNILNVSSLKAETYTAIARIGSTTNSGNYCSASKDTTLVAPGPLTLTPSFDSPTCYGGLGSVSVSNVAKEHGDINFDWTIDKITGDYSDSSSTSPRTTGGTLVSDLVAGTYKLVIRDNCAGGSIVTYPSLVSDYTITIPDALSFDSSGDYVDPDYDFVIPCFDGSQSVTFGYSNHHSGTVTMDIDKEISDGVYQDVTTVSRMPSPYSRDFTRGTYRCTISDGCSTTDQIKFSVSVLNDVTTAIDIVPTRLTYSTGYHIKCRGESNGQITVNLSGGNPFNSGDSYNVSLLKVGNTSFDQSPNSVSGNTYVFNALAAGTYTVSVVDENGCPKTRNVTLIEPSASLAIQAIDANDFTGTDNVQQIDGDLYVKCHNYAAVFQPHSTTVSGGVPSYSYKMNETTFSTSYTINFNDEPFKDFEFQVTDNNGCVRTRSFRLNNPDALSLTLSDPRRDPDHTEFISSHSGSVSCYYDVNDGKLIAEASGGLALSSSYDYEIYTTSADDPDVDEALASDNVSIKTFPSLSVPESYRVYAYDDLGCPISTTESLSLPSEVIFDTLALTRYNGYEIQCNNFQSAVSFVATGGTGNNYDLIIDTEIGPGSGTGASMEENFSAGNYVIQVQDQLACTSSNTINLILEEPTPLLLDLDSIAPLCYDINGRVIADASGGVDSLGNYWYEIKKATDVSYALEIINDTAYWDRPANGTSNQNYSVRVTDRNDCITTTEIEVTPDLTPLTISVTDTYAPNCDNAENGWIEFEVSNVDRFDDNTAIIYIVGDGYEDLGYDSLVIGTDADRFQNLLDTKHHTNYEIRVRDRNNCDYNFQNYVSSIPLIAPPRLQISPFGQNRPTIEGYDNGWIDIAVSGGVNSYLVSIDSIPQPMDTINNLTRPGHWFDSLDAGQHIVQLIDTNYVESQREFCLVEDTFHLLNGRSLNITNATQIGRITCPGSNDGSIQLIVTDKFTADTINTFLTITYQNIDTSDPIQTLEVVAGEIPILENLSSGTYQFAVKYQPDSLPDNTYADLVQEIEIEEPEPLGFSFWDPINPACETARTTGKLQFSVQGGYPDETVWYSLDGGTFTLTSRDDFVTIENLSLEEHTIELSKSDGSCLTSRSFTISNDQLIPTLLGKSDVSCYGGNDGWVKINSDVLGVDFEIHELPEYSSNLEITEDGQRFHLYDNLDPGEYHFIISKGDNSSCLDGMIAVTVGQPDDLALNVSVTIANCGQSDGALAVEVSGGTAPYEIEWRNKFGVVDPGAVPAGSYTVNVTDSLGCAISQSSIQVDDNPGIAVSIKSINAANCLNNDGEAIIEITSATGPFEVQGNPTTESIITLPNLYAGDTLITVMDSRGCDTTLVISVPSINTLEVVETTLYETTCEEQNGAVKLTLAGGHSPYSFDWGDSITSGDSLAGLGIGYYEVNVTDAFGCEFKTDFIIRAANGIESVTMEQTTPFCELSNGSIAFSEIVGDFNPFVIKRIEGLDTLDVGVFDHGDSLVVDGLSAGDYDFLIYDTNGCLFIVSNYSLTDDPDKIPTYTTSITNESSCGLETGVLAIESLTGRAPFTYQWEKEGSILPIDSVVGVNLSVGTYFITITDSTGCPVIVEADMIDRPIPIIDLLWAQSSPYGASNGSFAVELSGGVGSYSYYSEGETNEVGVFDGLAPGAYQVNGTDSLGCSSDTISVDIEGTLQLTVEFLGATSASCLSANDGQARVKATGGISPYTFLIGEDTVSAFIENLFTGTYYVQAVDAIGSVDSVLITIPVLDSLEVSEIVSLVSCEGGCDGGVDLDISGGSGSYEIVWNHGEIGANLSSLCPDTYFYTITDTRNGVCILSDSVTVGEQPYLALQVNDIVPPTCFDGGDGSIQVSGLGGSGYYDFNWSTGDSGSLLSSKSPGDYIVTVSDRLLGCTFSDTLTIPNTPVITVSDTTIFQPTCVGGSNGSITLTIINAPSPLVEWERGEFGKTLNNVSAGIYPFTITSGLGCEITGQIEVIDREPIEVTETVTNNLCSGYCEGVIELSVSGGTAPYYYEWSDGSSSKIRSRVCTGTYQYTVTDRYGCEYLGEVTVEEPDAIAITINNLQHAQCYRSSDGFIDINVSGGVGEYSYLWSNETETQDATGIQKGTYTVTVTDENACSVSQTFEIEEPTYLTRQQVELFDPLCSGASDGRAIVTPTGGTAPYEILWGDGQTTFEAVGLLAGTHSYSITDSHGCIYDNEVRLIDPDGMQVANVVLTDPQCFNFENGEITFEVLGGTGVYEFAWSNDREGDNTLDGIAHGTYEVMIQDENGCQISREFSLDNPDELFITGVPDYVLLCEGGEAVLEPDTEWVTYQWSGPEGGLSTDSRIILYEEGEYTLNVTNEDECPADTEVFIEVDDNVLQADFIRVSEAVVFEPVVIVDLSMPLPDAVEWVLPESDNIAVNQEDDAILELVFTEPGNYEIGSRVQLSNCTAELFKIITVSEESEDSEGRMETQASRSVGVKMFPNPTEGDFKVYLDAPSEEKFRVQLVNTDKNIMEEKIFQGEKNYVFDWDFSNSPAGVYFLVIQFGDNVQSKRILVLR